MRLSGKCEKCTCSMRAVKRGVMVMREVKGGVGRCDSCQEV